jgi:glucosamine-6-phosphate deaminase
MKIIVVNDYQELSDKAANIVANEMKKKKDIVLGLATGSTPEGLYKNLIKMYNNNEIDFSLVNTFNLDEYYGVSDTHPKSFHHTMNEYLFNHVNIKKENAHLPETMPNDVLEACKDYDNKIESLGGIDIQILGLGVNGHIGFNEPNDKFIEETHLVDLAEETIKSNSRHFNNINEVPKQGITMGIKNIMNAKKLLLIASGLNKADAVKGMIEGSVTPYMPASILQTHHDVTVIIDKEAASLLNKKHA